MEHTSTTPFSTTGFLLSQIEYSVAPEQKVDHAENELSTAGNDLSREKQASLSNLCRQKANHIRESIRHMRSMGFASDVISRTVDQSIREMTCAVSQFQDSVTSFEGNKQSVTNGLIDTSQKISGLNLSFQPILPQQRDYSVDVGCQDAIQACMNGKAMERLTQAKESNPKREPNAFQKSMQDMHEEAMGLAVDTRVIAAPLEAIGTVIHAAAKYGCNLTPTTKKACKATLEFGKGAVEVVKQGVTAVGAKPMAKKLVSVFTEKSDALPNYLMQHGVPSEIAHQFEKDAKTVILNTAAAGVIMAPGVVRSLLPSKAVATAGKVANAERRLLSNNHEIEIERATDPTTGQQYRTFLLAPEATQTSAIKVLLGPKQATPSTTLSVPSSKFPISTPSLATPKAWSKVTPITKAPSSQHAASAPIEAMPKQLYQPPHTPSLSKPQHTPVFPAVNNNKAIAITRSATGLPPNAATVPPHIDVKEVMEGGTVREYFGTQSQTPLDAFIRNSIHDPFKVTSVENPGSGNVLHTVSDSNGVPIAFVKEFIETRSPVSGFIPEIVSNTILRSENLMNSSLPDICDIGMYTTEYGEEKGLVMYSHISGHTIGELFKHKLPIPAKELGRVYGEIGAVESPLPVLEQYIKEKIDTISIISAGVFFNLNKLGIPTSLTNKHVEMISNAMKINPGKTGLVHGDAYHNNIIYDQGKLTVIDSGTLMASVNRVGLPHGMPVFDQQEIIVSIYNLGAIYGYPHDQIESIIAEYLAGYHELMPISSSEPAEIFARLYFEMMGLNNLIRGKYDTKLIEIAAERVNRVFGQTIPESMNKEIPSHTMSKGLDTPVLTAERINLLREAPIYFPVVSELEISEITQLHDIWSRNQEVLLGILAKEEIPCFGLHGTNYLGVKTIVNTKTANSVKGDYLWVAGIRYTRDPVQQLGDLYIIVKKATFYCEKKGGVFVLDVDTSNASATELGISERAKLIPLDSPMQRDILGQMEGKSNADEFHLQFNPDNYSKVVKGLILEEETLYPAEIIESLLSSDQSINSGILAERLKIQETLITIFEKLGVIKVTHNFPWETYQKIGKELLEANERFVSQNPRNTFFKSRVITEETPLLPEDLGFDPELFHEKNKLRELRGSMLVVEGSLKVKISNIWMPDSTMGPLLDAMGNLRKLARANNVGTLEIVARITNPRLKDVMIKRYGSYICEDASLETGWNLFRIPVESQTLQPSISKKIKRFMNDESGSVKLPLKSSYFIKLFEKIGYKLVDGGKGSHRKMTKQGSPLVTIPGEKELPVGTAKSLLRTYEQAIKIDSQEPTPVAPEQPSKLVKIPLHNKPLPHRIDYSQDFLQAKSDFVISKEFNGILSKDLFVIQYHGSGPLHQPRTHKWFMPACENNKHCTIDTIMDALAKLSIYGEITEVSIAKIPAGEPVRFLHGRASEKIDIEANEIRPGGGVQYRFFDFDTNWIVHTRKLPENETPALQPPKVLHEHPAIAEIVLNNELQDCNLIEKKAHSFFMDESGTGKSPFDVIPEKHETVMQTEHTLPKEALPAIQNLPQQHPKHLLQFLSNADLFKFSASKLGESKKGYLNAKIMYLDMATTECKSAVYCIRRNNPGRLKEKISWRPLIQSQYLGNEERISYILDRIFDRSRQLGHKRVFLLVHSDTPPIMTVMQSRSEKFIAESPFSQGILEKPIKLFEIEL